jgi:hypothetical protein
VLDERSVQARVHLPDGELGVDGEPCGVRHVGAFLTTLEILETLVTFAAGQGRGAGEDVN